MSSSITRISARELVALLHPTASSSSKSSSTPPPPATSILIIDVRDDDHIGGHITNSVHFPSTSLYRQLSRLQQRADGVDMVVFHCMLSQQRGPAAATQFAQYMSQHQQHGTHIPRIAILDKGMTGWVSHLHALHRQGVDVRPWMDKYDVGTWGYSFKPVNEAAAVAVETDSVNAGGGGSG